MNMIVNSSDLVGYEAETNKNSKKDLGSAQALNKLMKLWEAKQSRSGKKAFGFGLLAVTLAACNSDDDTPFAQSDIDTAVAAVDTTLDDAAAVTAALSPHATLAAAITSDNATVTAAATTAALTAADGTIYATVDAAHTAGVNTTSADAVTAALTSSDGTVHATVDAAITSDNATITAAATTAATTAAETTLMAGSGFATVSALLAAYSNATASVTPTTATLTTAGDTVNGTANNDTITGTGTTYTTGDLIVDASSVDADVMNITFTDDSTAVPTVAGIETINMTLDAISTAATTVPGDVATSFGLDLNGIAGGNVVMSVSKAASTVTGIAVDNVSDGTTVTTDLTAVRVDVEANADTTIALTGATTNTLTSQTGTGDNLTVTATGSGLLLVTDVDAEENIIINNLGGAVELTDATAATDTLSTMTINAGGAITITDSNNIGSFVATTTTGNIAADVGAASTTVNLSTGNGDITISDASDAVTSVTAVAVGDGNVLPAGANADGDITVTDANTVALLTLTASGVIALADVDDAQTLVLTAGEASTLADNVSEVQTLTIASNSSAATPVTFTAADGDGVDDQANDGLIEMDNLNFSGSNSVTFLMAGADLVLLEAEDTGATDTAAPLIISDTAMTGGTSRFELNASPGANAVNTRSMVVDEIAVSYTLNANESFNVASGQNFVVGADTTTGDLVLAAPAVAGNTATVTIEDDADAANVNDVNGGITTTNIGTLNIAALDAANTSGTALAMGAVNVGTANAVKLTGAAAMTVASVTAATFDASEYTGALSFTVISTGATAHAVITGGSGADTFTSDADENFTVDGGAGLDTIVLSANDYSDNTVSMTSIETIDITASGIALAGSDMHNSSAVITGDAANDTLGINATTATGETINISNTATTALVTITGLAGSDNLTGSATTATIFTGAAGSDTIVGGSGADTVNVLLEAAAADGLTLGGGADSVVVDNASAAATVSAVLITDFNAGTVATVVDTITIDGSAINSMGNVTALSDSNSGATDGNDSVVVRLAADDTAVGTVDVVVLSQDYATDTLALAGMATAGSDTFTYAGLDDNDGLIVAYFDGTHTNIAIAVAGATGTSSNDFDSVETIFVLQNADFTAVLNTGDIVGAA